MTTISDMLVIYRLICVIPIHETIGALVEIALLSTGIMIKWDRGKK